MGRCGNTDAQLSGSEPPTKDKHVEILDGSLDGWDYLRLLQCVRAIWWSKE
jgi:hypothetical protein